jgi:hypothetical protein
MTNTLSRLRDALTTEVARWERVEAFTAMDAHRMLAAFRALAAPPPHGDHAEVDAGPDRCTGLTARWCPIHGDCSCDAVEGLGGSACPLHAMGSNHVEGESDPLAALAATPDARPDPRATLDWIEHNVSGGLHLVATARAKAHVDPRLDLIALEWIRANDPAALPASPQATTPAPSHDAKE